MSTDVVRGKNEPKRQPNIGQVADGSGKLYGRRTRTPFGWADVDAQVLYRLVTRLCDAGHGLVLGKTSDGGALSITVLDGEQRVKDWPSSSGDFEQFVEWALHSFGVAD